MAQVIHTVEVVYGSYSGTTTVRCDADDDLDFIMARVKKQEGLNFLIMASCNVKIVNTDHLPY